MINSRISLSRLSVLLVAIAAFVNSAILPTLSNTRAYGPSAATIPLTPELDNNEKETAGACVGSAYAQLGMRFEKNQGQFDAQVKFAARGAGYALWLTGDEAVMTLSGNHGGASAGEMARAVIDQQKSPDQISEEKVAVIRMKLVNSNRTPGVSGESELPGQSNYFIGNDSAKWRTGVSGYSRVVYKSVYRGVDLVYYGNGRELEYDFKLAAGANPAAIGIRFDGAKRLRVDPTGDLVIGLETGEVRQHKPLAYQEAAGERREVSASYVLRGKNQISFALGRYDRSKPLVIDPVLAYSTFLGGSSTEQVAGIAVDATGNAYVTGATVSMDFPFSNTIGINGPGNRPLFVSKLNPNGSALIYSTLISGNTSFSGSSSGVGIAVDKTGNAYVTGQTTSTSFPTTPGAFQSISHGGTEAFALKLNASGTALIYSTYLGGMYEDSGKGIAVDSVGNAYVTGQTESVDFPTANAMQPMMGGYQDAFVTKVNATGTALVYSTFLGGVENESGNGIAVDTAGNAYVTGGTTSDDFPTANALQSKYGGRGAFKSSDGGNNWSPVLNTYPITKAVTAIALDPGNSSLIYIGTFDHGLFKSTNGGVSWAAINNGIPDLTSQGFPGFYFSVYDLEIDRTNPLTLFAGTYGSGAYKSTDGGNSWTRKVGVLVTSVKIDPANAANVYVTEVVSPGFLRSTDGGESWEQYGNISSNYTLWVSAIAPTVPATIYVGTVGGGVFRFRGTDSALQVLPNKPTYAIAVDPSNSATIYAGTVLGMFKSTDSGDSWAPMNNGMLYNGYLLPSIVCLAIDSSAPNTIYAGTNAYVFKSTDGGESWVKANGLPTTYMFDVGIDPQTTSRLYVAANTVNDAFVSRLNPVGSTLAYSTYLGGLDIDVGFGIAVDADSSVYVAGDSYSASIPGVVSPLPRRGNGDAFALKLRAQGTLKYFTYVGGGDFDQATSIAVDAGGNAYISGNTTSSDFPTTSGAIPVAGGSCAFCTHAFVTKLDPTGTSLLYSTYLGGNPPGSGTVGASRDSGKAIAVDPAARVYAAGGAFSENFPVTAGALDGTYNGSGDGFVAKIDLFDICMQDDTNGNLLRFSTTTGDYLFTNCRKGMVYAGRGSVATNFCKITLNASMPGQTLTALANTCTRAASAQLVAQGKTLTITDKDMGNDSCACQ